MVQVKDGKIIRRSLPKTGVLSNGRTVSNYDRLPAERLREEGWLPVVTIHPAFDPEKEYLGTPTYTIEEDGVVKEYQVLPLPDAPDDVELIDLLEIAVIEITEIIGKLKEV